MSRILSGIVSAVVLLAGFLVLVAIVGLIVAYPVMLLWNGCLVPAVEGVREVGWVQMWGIIILFGILFRSSTSSST